MVKNTNKRKNMRAFVSIFRQLCAFLFIFPLFFQISVYGYHFLIVFTVEFIPMVKNTIDSKKCEHAQALLGTYVHFWSYFPLFQLAVYGYHFWMVFAVEIIPIVKNITKSNKYFWHLCAFLFIFPTFFFKLINCNTFLNFRRKK